MFSELNHVSNIQRIFTNFPRHKLKRLIACVRRQSSLSDKTTSNKSITIITLLFKVKQEHEPIEQKFNGACCKHSNNFTTCPSAENHIKYKNILQPTLKNIKRK